MPYGADLRKIPIDHYRSILEKQVLLPSRNMIKDNLEGAFRAFKQDGIKTVYDLREALSTPGRMSLFAERINVPETYLTLLRREIGSLEPKSVRLAEFPGVSVDTLQAMRQNGLMTSKDYYDFCQDNKDKCVLSFKLALSMSEVETLCCLSNLVRISGVGAIVAKRFLDAGYRCVTSIAETTAEEMVSRLSSAEESTVGYKTNPGAKEMQYCIDYAKLIVEFDKAQ